ncbi:PucR family transcriptional regulator [Aminipila terrae]|uniref:PucR family transcriptional regulator n=1 Tax=Aminipila terrae TaxID=2697030 RepID=A0A6P1MGU3_9FIRM|nr:PucR family transcriptional regulator [Aminipila terrae]QHI71794.1 hypothetical protein Ami3637_04785 [Aminipila terrae]
MSITVKDCLQLPSLSLGSVIAGRDGLFNIVNTVSVAEFECYDDCFKTANELLITAFYSIRDDVEAQCKAIEEYKKSGEVGLILFYSGMILKHIDQKLIDTANRLDFPIILLPGENMGLRYSDVISDIMEAVFMDRKSSNFFVNNTMERISQLPSSERNIANVLRFASDYAKAAFFLCDQSENIIGSAYWPLTNVLNFKIVQSAFKTPSRTTQSDETDSYSFFKMQFTDHKGADLALYAATMHEVLTTSIMNQVIEIIQLFATIWNYNLNLSTKESLIPALIEGDYDLAAHIAAIFNITLSSYNAMMILDIQPIYQQTDLTIQALSRIRCIFSNYEKNFISDSFSNHIIILGSFAKNRPLDNILLEELDCEFTKDKSIKCYSFFNNLEHIKDFRSSYVTYGDSINLTCKIYPLKKFYTDSEINFANKCISILNAGHTEREKYLKIIYPIIEDGEADLVHTLTTYLLDANSETKKTAELLFVHRNTIQYRLSKIRDLINMDFNQMPMTFEVYLAVALYRVLTQ